MRSSLILHASTCNDFTQCMERVGKWTIRLGETVSQRERKPSDITEFTKSTHNRISRIEDTGLHQRHTPNNFHSTSTRSFHPSRRPLQHEHDSPLGFCWTGAKLIHLQLIHAQSFLTPARQSSGTHTKTIQPHESWQTYKNKAKESEGLTWRDGIILNLLFINFLLQYVTLV